MRLSEKQAFLHPTPAAAPDRNLVSSGFLRLGASDMSGGAVSGRREGRAYRARPSCHATCHHSPRMRTVADEQSRSRRKILN